MNLLLIQPLSAAAFFCFLAAVLSLWIIPRRADQLPWISFGFAAISFLLAALENRIQGIGAIGIGLLGLLSFSFYHFHVQPILRGLIGISLIFLSYLIGSHHFPGFYNWPILPDFTFSQDAPPVSLYLNFDKPWIGFFLCAFGIKSTFLFSKETKLQSLSKRLGLPLVGKLTLGTSLVLLGGAGASHFVKVDFKWFEFSWIWLLTNLVFTCVTEEAFFRGFIQKELSSLLGSVPSWIVTSVIFGAAHLAGGPIYAILAFVAGLSYGYAFLKTERIEASILVHFFVNAIHFTCFTYPCIKAVT